MRDVSIVMYHYVRDSSRTPYPSIKARGADEFAGQMDYLSRHHSFITADQLMDAVSDDAPLPPRSVLLTFDDGYSDHYAHVLPVLERYRASAVFFPVGSCIRESQVLDANKIHFILASEPDSRVLAKDLIRRIDEYRGDFDLETEEVYRSRIQRKNRYDSEDILFFKSLLQRDLPEAIRRQLLDDLFRRYVTEDEAAFARELYLTPDQMTEMVDRGMSFGSHGYTHQWLDTLSFEEQEVDVDLSLTFLEDFGLDRDRWMMCYPYGGYNSSTLKVLRDRGCSAAVTTRPEIADLSMYDPLQLPRLDTNDLPVTGSAPPNGWTLRTLSPSDEFTPVGNDPGQGVRSFVG